MEVEVHLTSLPFQFFFSQIIEFAFVRRRKWESSFYGSAFLFSFLFFFHFFSFLLCCIYFNSDEFYAHMCGGHSFTRVENFGYGVLYVFSKILSKGSMIFFLILRGMPYFWVLLYAPTLPHCVCLFKCWSLFQNWELRATIKITFFLLFFTFFFLLFFFLI